MNDKIQPTEEQLDLAEKLSFALQGFSLSHDVNACAQLIADHDAAKDTRIAELEKSAAEGYAGHFEALKSRAEAAEALVAVCKSIIQEFVDDRAVWLGVPRHVDLLERCRAAIALTPEGMTSELERLSSALDNACLEISSKGSDFSPAELREQYLATIDAAKNTKESK
jgi:hypothetical protein